MPIELFRNLVLVAFVVVLVGGLWLITRRRLQTWARDTEGEPWFAPSPLFGMGIVPVTWQGWLVCLAILLVTFALGLLGAAGVFGPGNHLHH